MTRLPSGGQVDRTDVRTFTLDGVQYQGLGGDTLASALLANSVVAVSNSIYRQRPRGIMTADGTEPNALAQVERWPSGGPTEPSLPLTTLELVDGLELSTISGIGRLDPQPDRAIYDKKYAFCDVLVIGGGQAGLEAADRASQDGDIVMLVERSPHLGGRLLDEPGGSLAAVEDQIERLDDDDLATVLTRAEAFGVYDQNYVLVLENRTDHLSSPAGSGISRHRIWHIRADRLVLATGILERPLVFADNDRPGIMLSSAVRTYLNRFGVRPGERMVVAAVDDSAYATALDFAATGGTVAALADSRATPPADLADRLAQAGIPVLAGAVVNGTSAGPDGCLRGVRIAVPDGQDRWIDADLLAVNGGWNPDLHLWSQARGTTEWDEVAAAFVPAAPHPAQPKLEVVGAATGSMQRSWNPQPQWLTPAPGPDTSHWHEHFVDLHRDATVADVFRATGTGMRSIEHVKRYTTIGTGREQGATAAVNAAAVAALGLGLSGPEALGISNFRPPSRPVGFAALAGREVGRLADPVRTTPIHRWHVEHGARFENVGQWKRPWYYPQNNESMDDAVLRECRSARTSVGMMDASTLGTIEVVGPDAGEFLNRIYTNAFAKLKVGSARYGLMCTPDGMVMDDGVTMRLSPERFLMSTTTGNAARVLDWLEEWSQTEWPQLDVTFTSVTEQWSTVAVVGPKARAVVAPLVPTVDVSNDAFGFMTFQETPIHLGEAAIPGIIARISFSGELAFELKVPGWYGLALWESVYAAGSEYGITPYGTETMHVLRAEKGYPIIGQDTDGTVTPFDLGMGWAVSKTKDFIGKRSLRRTDTAREGRRHLVGLLPVDHSVRLPEGAQLIEPGTPLDQMPVPMIGHVTSSYQSAALERTFALAMLKDGFNRIGQTVLAPVDGQLIDATVTSSVLYDPEGARRDG